MKTYHIKWSGTVYETAEVQATDADEAVGSIVEMVKLHGIPNMATNEIKEE